ncbi:hypothetical protein NA56DRAFT_707346 [Hyaloscypha hepaticicola]|uniref:Uncharacterized protein n=1 Tax=Hyaloscypha hepaticicola TaxID=2082293 RepID=A0A2J6PVA1_9HELO|nr:hypothetical protein NA56DRAFT_707346 [Hyaloscypha hepaticicola]
MSTQSTSQVETPVAEIPSNKIDFYFNKQLIYRLDENNIPTLHVHQDLGPGDKKQLLKITNAIDNLRVDITEIQNTLNKIDVNGALKSHLGLLQDYWTRVIDTHLSRSSCTLPEGPPSLSDDDPEIGKLISKLEEVFKNTLKDMMSAALREWDKKWAIPKEEATGTSVTTITTEDKIEQQKWVRSMILQTLEKWDKQRREEKEEARGEKEEREAASFYHTVVKLIERGREGVLGFWIELSPIVAVKLLPCWLAADNGCGLNWWLWEAVLISLGYATIPLIYVWLRMHGMGDLHWGRFLRGWGERVMKKTGRARYP